MIDHYSYVKDVGEGRDEVKKELKRERKRGDNIRWGGGIGM